MYYWISLLQSDDCDDDDPFMDEGSCSGYPSAASAVNDFATAKLPDVTRYEIAYSRKSIITIVVYVSAACYPLRDIVSLKDRWNAILQGTPGVMLHTRREIVFQ